MRSARVAGLFLILGLVIPATAIDPKYLPPNSEAAVTINLKQLLASELVKSKKELIDTGKKSLNEKLQQSGIKSYLDKAGIDLFRDIHTITVSSDGSKAVDAMFIVVEGKFDAEKFVEVAQEAADKDGNKFKVSKQGNANIFEITPNDDEKTIHAALINDNLLVAAPTRQTLDGVIARAGSGRGVGAKGKMKSLLETTNNKQTLSIVGTGAAIGKILENAPKAPQGDIGAMIQSIEGFAFSITVGKDIQFEVAADAADEENATKIVGMGNFGLVAARGMINQKAQEDAKFQPVADIAKTLRLTNQGSSIILRGNVSADNIERIYEMLPQR